MIILKFYYTYVATIKVRLCVTINYKHYIANIHSYVVFMFYVVLSSDRSRHPSWIFVAVFLYKANTGGRVVRTEK